MKDETFWDDFASDMHSAAPETESFYSDASCRTVRLVADIVHMFNSVMMIFGFVCILRITL